MYKAYPTMRQKNRGKWEELTTQTYTLPAGQESMFRWPTLQPLHSTLLASTTGSARKSIDSISVH